MQLSVRHLTNKQNVQYTCSSNKQLPKPFCFQYFCVTFYCKNFSVTYIEFSRFVSFVIPKVNFFASSPERKWCSPSYITILFFFTVLRRYAFEGKFDVFTCGNLLEFYFDWKNTVSVVAANKLNDWWVWAAMWLAKSWKQTNA